MFFVLKINNLLHIDKVVFKNLILCYHIYIQFNQIKASGHMLVFSFTN